MRPLTALIAATLILAGPPASAREKAGAGKTARAARLWDSCHWTLEAPNDRRYRKCYRSKTGEYRFAMPRELPQEHRDVLAQVDRVNGELAEGMDMVARQDRDDASAAGLAFQPWVVEINWSMDGLNARLASLTAEGTLAPRPSRHPNAAPRQKAIAMLVDRRTGRFITDAADVFSDQMENLRSLYCTRLDIHRIAKVLDANPTAWRAGQPPIVDDEGRYLGKWGCPYFGELAISFSGGRGGPFEVINIVAEPGLAGPEEEGYYRDSIDITPAMLEHIRPEYREAFRDYQGCEDCARLDQ